MINKDDKLLGEAYEQMNEGLFDRMGAKKAGKQAFKQAGGKTGLAGLAQKAGQAIGKAAGMQVSPEQEAQAQAQQKAQSQAQVGELANNYMNQIFGILDKMTAAMAKLGIENVEQVQDARMKYWLKGIMKLKADMQAQAETPAEETAPEGE